MRIELQQGRMSDLEAAVLAVPGFEGNGNDEGLNELTGGWINEVRTSGEFNGKPEELAILHRPPGMKSRRLALGGAGPEEQFDEARMRRLAGTVVRALKAKSLRSIHFFLPERFATASFAQAAVEGAILGGFEPDQLRTDPRKNDQKVEVFTVCTHSGGTSLGSSVENGRVIGESQNFARELVNQPANLLTPLALADRAREMAEEAGLACEIFDEARMREIGMGSLLGVSMGSDNPPAFIVIRYSPANALSGDHIALVGKGVTFDTGGISIKPADGMEKMKYDMGGAAGVLGAMRAIARLKPNVRVTGFVPTVENMVSGRAQRPGDIVTSLSGRTIEVLNTDAEGRLILADALTYSIREGCTHLIDAATLTGAIVVALGHLYVGTFSNNDDLAAKLMEAGTAVGERYWRMPMDDEYKEYLKSAFADLPNIGGRWAGSITAAKFLEEFVESKPWVHLDIAGTAWLDDPKPFLAKGPTGVGVRTFVNFAMRWTPQA